MRIVALVLALSMTSAFADKKTCIDAGEGLYTDKPDPALLAKAGEHCRPLAEAGDAQAQYYYASTFFFSGPKPDAASVERWMARAAEGGHASAQFYMGSVHLSNRELDKALEMYEKAARNGVPPAPLELGRIWRHGGYGFAPDADKAIHWYEFAARKYRLRDAMHALVELYRDKDPHKAAYWKAEAEKKACCK